MADEHGVGSVSAWRVLGELNLSNKQLNCMALLGGAAGKRPPWSAMRHRTLFPVPRLVNLLLVFAVDKEREPFGEFEVRAAIAAHEGLTTDDEFRGSDWAVLASASDVLDRRV